MTRASLVDEIATVRAICRELGLGEITPTLLKAAHHTTLLIPSLKMVARVQSAEPRDVAEPRAVRELAVVRHLASRGAPMFSPIAGELAGPYVAGSLVVTLWRHVEHKQTDDEADASLAAVSLASLHRCLSDYGGALPPYTQALDRCWKMLAHGGASVMLAGEDRDLLKAHFRRLRQEIEGMTQRWVPLHGDAHLGNFLLTQRGPVWTDFEDACLGPREHDIAGLPSDMWPYFSDADQALIRRLADLKSVCVAVWCGADIARSDEVREAAEYHLQRVREFGP